MPVMLTARYVTNICLAAAAAAVDGITSDPGYSSAGETASDSDDDDASAVYNHAKANKRQMRQQQQPQHMTAATTGGMVTPGSRKQQRLDEVGTGIQLNLLSSCTTTRSQSPSSHGVTIEMLRMVSCCAVVLCCAVLPCQG
jgi:hypothetical protein